jgi:hypothetical protein
MYSFLGHCLYGAFTFNVVFLNGSLNMCNVPRSPQTLFANYEVCRESIILSIIYKVLKNGGIVFILCQGPFFLSFSLFIQACKCTKTCFENARGPTLCKKQECVPMMRKIQHIIMHTHHICNVVSSKEFSPVNKNNKE